MSLKVLKYIFVKYNCMLVWKWSHINIFRRLVLLQFSGITLYQYKYFDKNTFIFSIRHYCKIKLEQLNVWSNKTGQFFEKWKPGIHPHQFRKVWFWKIRRLSSSFCCQSYLLFLGKVIFSTRTSKQHTFHKTTWQHLA